MPMTSIRASPLALRHKKPVSIWGGVFPEESACQTQRLTPISCRTIAVVCAGHLDTRCANDRCPPRFRASRQDMPTRSVTDLPVAWLPRLGKSHHLHLRSLIYALSTGVVALTQTQEIFTPDEPLIQMVLCPAFFNAANFIQSLSPSPAPSANEYLGNWRFAAAALVHEFFHIFGNTCTSRFSPVDAQYGD